MIEDFLHVLDSIRLTAYQSISGLLPRLIAAALILIAAWLLAGAARWAANRAARTEWLERLLIRSGLLSGLVEPSLAMPRRLAGDVLYWWIILAGAAFALSALSDQIALHLQAIFLVVLPNLVLAAGIVFASWWLGSYWARSTLIWMSNEGIAHPWRWAAIVRICTIGAGIALASEATGFASVLIRSSFLILLAGCTLALAQAAWPILRVHLESALAPEEQNVKSRSDGQFPL